MSKKDQHGKLNGVLAAAVVFDDIGSSIYYTPQVLFAIAQMAASVLVVLTFFVFLGVASIQAEVADRFRDGGGVVSSGSYISPLVGALGGSFISVSYYLTTATSVLAGVLMLGLLIPLFANLTVAIITSAILILALGILNWFGIKDSAVASLVAAILAMIGFLWVDYKVISTVPISVLGHFLLDAWRTFDHLPVLAKFISFSGAFLAFSGVETITQLSPELKAPHKRTILVAMLIVVLCMVVTALPITFFATVLLPGVFNSPDTASEVVALLGGDWQALVTVVVIGGAILLIMAGNAAIVGNYHVNLALSHIKFLPKVFLYRDPIKGSPLVSIGVSCFLPILVLLVTAGNITALGETYASTLLGSFSITCASNSLTCMIEHVRALLFSKEKYEALIVRKYAKLGYNLPDGKVPFNKESARSASRILNTLVVKIPTTAAVCFAWYINIAYRFDVSKLGLTIVGTVLIVLLAYKSSVWVSPRRFILVSGKKSEQMEFSPNGHKTGEPVQKIEVTLSPGSTIPAPVPAELFAEEEDRRN
ncbi:MAG TPA: APC family permease [Candidatus Saccharimonadales bacterium]|nr:APC family permease [Candidatus Saccharimonadales bacterium]